MTMFPFLKDNITALEKASPALYDWLSRSHIDEQSLKTSVFVNRWGHVDWRIPGASGLFEAMPPGLLYRDWPNMDKPELSASVIIGCNVGYGLNHLLVNTPDSHKILVIEPNAELLLACLGQTDYRPFFANKKLHFISPNEEHLNEYVRHLDLQYVYGKIYLRGDIPSRQLGPEYARWTETVKNRLENFSVEMITLRCRQDVMVGNELKNFRRAHADGSLLSLKDAARGVGAVVLGAGPSLERFAPELAADPGYALYASALQTLPVLRRLGLKPHFCLALDYDGSMLSVYNRLDADWASDIPLIYSTKVNPEVVRRYPGPTLPLWTQGGLGTFAMQDHEFVLDAGGNVSLTLVRLLRWMGASSILLAGQDFAWKGGSTHAMGHHAAGREVAFDPAMHQRLKNLWGEEIISSVQYLTSKRDLENDIKKAPFRIANLYGGGVVIEGAPAVDLEQARGEGLLACAPGSRERFLNALGQARGTAKALRFEPRSHIWTSSFRGLEKRMQKLFRQCGQSQDEIHTLLEQALFFVRQDPLYLPYLFNETIDLAGLAKTRRSYHPADLSEFKRIGKSILAKVREVDRCVGGLGDTNAA